MDLPDISMWNAGSQHDAETFNAVTDAMSFLLNPPECQVRQTAAQSIPTGINTPTAITFHTVDRDNDGMWDSATPTYITIQTPGWYEVEYAICYATRSEGTASNGARSASPYLNGSLTSGTALAWNIMFVDTTATPQLWYTYDLFLNVGDKLYLGAAHSSATALSTASSATAADQQTLLRARWASL